VKDEGHEGGKDGAKDTGGRPVVIGLPTEDEPVKVVCGDALSVLRELPAGSFDAVITDPPFSETTHAGARSFATTGKCARKGFAKGEGTRALIDFAAIDADTFLALCRECVRVARRWVILTCDWRHAAAAEQMDSFVRLGVWVKPDAAPQFSGDRPAAGWEAVLLLHRPGRKRWRAGGAS
jgi:hypothetical protein